MGGVLDTITESILANTPSNTVRDENVVLQDYLSTIYRLEEIYGIAKTGMIASELDVTPATVTKMLTRLSRLGLVSYDKYRGAILTDRGRLIAESIIRKHRICEYFLKFILDFSISEAHRYAHIMEHLPDIIIEKIFELSGRPKFCPHGNPIPGTDHIATKQREDFSLEDAPDLSEVKVVRILGELKKTLEFLERIGIDIGTVLKVEGRDQKNIYVRKHEQDNIVPIPRAVAFQIRVVKL